MALERSAGYRRGISVISLADPLTARLIFRTMGHTPRARRTLRRDIFARVAQSANLQRQIMEVLAKHPEIHRTVVMELAKDSHLRARLMALAGQQTDSRRLPSAASVR